MQLRISFMLLFMRVLGVGRVGALVGGIVFAFGSFFVAQIQHENVVRSAAWLPLVLLFVEQMFFLFGARFCAYTSAAPVAVGQMLAGYPVLWHLVLFAVFFVGFISLFVVMFSTVALHRAPSTSPAHDGPPPPAFFLGFFGMWLVMMLGWASNVGFSIYLAVRANEGKWTRYPLVGRIAMRLGGFG